MKLTPPRTSRTSSRTGSLNAGSGSAVEDDAGAWYSAGTDDGAGPDIYDENGDVDLRAPGQDAEDGEPTPPRGVPQAGYWPQSGESSGGGSRAAYPGRTKSFDLRNTWQILVGAILIPVGIAAIILAWYGAAHARVDQQQIPYLISGGFLGLGAIIAGALLFWSHWLYRIYDQADLQHHELMRSQAELRDALLGRSAWRDGDGDHGSNGWGSGWQPEQGGGAPGGREGADAGRPGGSFLATATGTNFHRPDCPVVARHPKGLRQVSEQETDDLAPCRICEPLGPGRG